MSNKFKMISVVLLIVIIGLSLTLLTAFAMQPPPLAPTSAKSHTDEPTKSQVTFADVTADVGITASHTISLMSYYPTGQAWADYDKDGWLDLYLTNNNGPNKLYKNNGDGTFSLSPFSSQVALTNSLSGGAVFADFNNDGWRDLYVLNVGINKLYQNEEGNGFTDITSMAGVGDNGPGTTGAWGDYDEDGYLDLYVTNWGTSQDILYHNNGDGSFTDATQALVYTTTLKHGFTVSFMDYDNDGDQDIYVVNDKLEGNVLWQNDGPGCSAWCFTDVSVASQTNIQVFGMGLATGDYDNDGDLDFYFSDIGPGNLLENQASQGSLLFTDVTTTTATGADAVGWGTFFFDYDNDGFQDLYLAVMSDFVLPNGPNRLFRNLGSGTFSDVSAQSNANDEGVTIGVAYADYNNDGWLDIILGNRDEGYHLYQNLGDTNNWITFNLIGGGPINRDAIGSRIYVQTNSGQTQMQEVKSGSSLGAGNDLALHFGLGSTEQAIESVQVVWADGYVQHISGLDENTSWQVIYPIDLETTIGFNTNQCPTNHVINFAGTVEATICYEITNSSAFTFDIQKISDSALNSLPTVLRTLAPGESVQITRTAVLSHSFVNTTTWQAINDQNQLTQATDVITATQLPLSALTLTATVGQDSGACATTQVITTTSTSDLTYCYTVTNNSPYTYTNHSVNDSLLGSIASSWPYSLPPGATTSLTHTATVTQTAVHTITWTAFADSSFAASASDTVSVAIIIPNGDHRLYLPYISR